MPEFLLFRSAGRDFALPVGAVEGVGEESGTVPMPYVPSYVEGLTGTFDRVVPQQSLMARLGETVAAADERALILVDDGAGGTALRVGAVDRIVFSRTTPRPSAGLGGANGICGGDLMIGRRGYSLVNPQALSFLPEPAAGLDVREPEWDQKPCETAPAAGVTASMMVFACGSRRFAVPYADVARVAVMPSVIHPIQAPKPILGRSRDDSALVVSLSGALGIDGAGTPAVVVVVAAGSKEVAFTADSTLGILDCRRAEDGADRVTLADGSAAETLDLKALADRFARPAEAGRAPALPLAKRREAPAAGRTRLMTVRVNESWYGLSADLVRRVGKPSGYARLYGDNRRFDGIAVVDGDALPAIDLHRVFQAPRRSSGIAAVMSTRDGTLALMCDALGQLDEVPTDRIEPTGEPYIAGRISRSTQTIRMIDLRSIVRPERAA